MCGALVIIYNPIYLSLFTFVKRFSKLSDSAEPPLQTHALLMQACLNAYDRIAVQSRPAVVTAILTLVRLC